MHELVKQLDDHREKYKVTKRDLCNAADITVEYYLKVLKEKHNISLPIFCKMADYLGLDVKLCLK